MGERAASSAFCKETLDGRDCEKLVFHSQLAIRRNHEKVATWRASVGVWLWESRSAGKKIAHQEVGVQADAEDL